MNTTSVRMFQVTEWEDYTGEDLDMFKKGKPQERNRNYFNNNTK